MLQRFHFPREPLLIEIERRCAFSDCGAKNQIGLTKDEAIEYRGFECSKCERWNQDLLNQFELPDSWANRVDSQRLALFFFRLSRQQRVLVQTSTSIEEKPRRNGSRPYPRMLPQWALDLCRPVVGVLSRLLWGVRCHHLEYIPLSGGLIIASNHQSYLDPFWNSYSISRPVRFLAWDAAFRWPVVGLLLRMFGAWPLQLEGSDPAPIRRSIQWLSEGGAVVIFPEGGRGNPDGSMKKFKAGAVRMALEAGVPILPVTIRGGHRVWPNTLRFPRLKRGVEIIYHPLFIIEQRQDEETRECARRETERLAEIVRSAL